MTAVFAFTGLAWGTALSQEKKMTITGISCLAVLIGFLLFSRLAEKRRRRDEVRKESVLHGER